MKRKGFALLETMFAVLLFSVCIVQIFKLTSVKVNEVQSLSIQSDVMAADAYMNEIYHAFHLCDSMTVSGNQNTDDVELVFILKDNSVRSFRFNRTLKQCYLDGIEQFGADNFLVTGNKYNLQVSLKLPTTDELTLDIFK